MAFSELALRLLWYLKHMLMMVPLVLGSHYCGKCFLCGILRQTDGYGCLSVADCASLLTVSFNLLATKSISAVRSWCTFCRALTSISKHSLSCREIVVLVALRWWGGFGEFWGFFIVNNAIISTITSHTTAFRIRRTFRVSGARVEVFLSYAETWHLRVFPK